MHAYKIYRIYLTFIAFSAMLTNHTFTDYFITVEPLILDVGFFNRPLLVNRFNRFFIQTPVHIIT